MAFTLLMTTPQHTTLNNADTPLCPAQSSTQKHTSIRWQRPCTDETVRPAILMTHDTNHSVLSTQPVVLTLLITKGAVLSMGLEVASQCSFIAVLRAHCSSAVKGRGLTSGGIDTTSKRITCACCVCVVSVCVWRGVARGGGRRGQHA